MEGKLLGEKKPEVKNLVYLPFESHLGPIYATKGKPTL